MAGYYQGNKEKMKEYGMCGTVAIVIIIAKLFGYADDISWWVPVILIILEG